MWLLMSLVLLSLLMLLCVFVDVIDVKCGVVIAGMIIAAIMCGR